MLTTLIPVLIIAFLFIFFLSQAQGGGGGGRMMNFGKSKLKCTITKNVVYDSQMSSAVQMKKNKISEIVDFLKDNKKSNKWVQEYLKVYYL